MGLGVAGSIAAAGLAVSAAGAIQQGQAQAASSSYQAAVAANNAKTAEQNAVYTTLAGEQQSQQEGLKAGQRQGLIKASQAASGIDVNSGSAVDVQSSQRAADRLSEETVAQNAALRAYGYRTQGTGFQAQAGLDKAAADEAPIAAAFGAAGGLLKGAGQLGLIGGASSNLPGGLPVASI